MHVGAGGRAQPVREIERQLLRRVSRRDDRPPSDPYVTAQARRPAPPRRDRKQMLDPPAPAIRVAAERRLDELAQRRDTAAPADRELDQQPQHEPLAIRRRSLGAQRRRAHGRH